MADFSRFTGRGEEVTRPLEHQRPQPEKERDPSYYQKTQDRDRGDSGWSGSSWGGGTMNGRGGR